ncbi:MAG: sulfatase-like hydrolase/transferase [Burkholderiales bacterium]|nr:sulfatase-like hydrolase/transferase [Burkholderiales bacterium]
MKRHHAILLAVFGTLTVVVALMSVVEVRQTVLVWYVKHFLRIKTLPEQTVTWEQGVPSGEPAGRRRPNIVLILADDLGINDITLMGGGVAEGTVPTPNIDSIGKSGVHFKNAYAGNATCSPSRAALMTGRYATRFGFEFTPVPITFSAVVAGKPALGTLNAPLFHSELALGSPRYEKMGMPASEITLAKLLAGAGYHTVHLGKWHLGEAAEFSPKVHGFKESLGFLAGASMYLPENHPDVVNAQQDFDPLDRFLWAAQPWRVAYNQGPNFAPSAYMTDYLTQQAQQVIKANRDRPFFMYLAYNAPHTPLQATKEDFEALSHIEDRSLRVYAAMIRSLDRNVGKVLSTLKEQGLDDNTLVIFTSDNGAPHYIGLSDLNKPYRGWKATFFEGGIRVPYLMRYPKKIASGSTYTEAVSHFDFFATAAAAAGVDIPKDRVIDGVDLIPFLSGSKEKKPHEALFWRSGKYKTVQAGQWKLQVAEHPAKRWLFDLKNDPTEQNNLIETRADMAAKLWGQLQAFDAAQRPPLWPSLLEAPVSIDKDLRQLQNPADEFVYWSN